MRQNINIKRLLVPVLLFGFLFLLVACNGEKETTDSVTELNTELTDGLRLDLSYEGKVFQTDRVGEVTLSSCIDGDTAKFISAGTEITVRFLDIDTPETKGELEPWGKAASDFTCEKLTNAQTIVLEGREQLKDTYGRYLAYVWYDNRLLNLEIVELAYSQARSVSDYKYGQYFQQAETKARATGRRIYGEKDPDFHYGKIELDLKTLRQNIDQYMGKNIIVEGIVSARLGPNPFIQNEEGYGIYIWMNYESTTRLNLGNHVRVEATVSEFGGTAQLIGVTRTKVTVLAENQLDRIKPHVLTIPDITDDHVGALITLKNLEITGIQQSGEARNIYVKDENNNTIMLRIDRSVASRFEELPFEVGKKINVTAPLSKYEGQYQLMLFNEEDEYLHFH